MAGIQGKTLRIRRPRSPHVLRWHYWATDHPCSIYELRSVDTGRLLLRHRVCDLPH